MSFFAALKRRTAFEGGLDEVEEVRLIRMFRSSGDQAALDRLIDSHNALILGCIRRLGLSRDVLDNMREDLFNEGVLGLMSAIRNFDETKERRLSALAKFHIRAHMTEFVLSNMSAVHPVNSRAQRTAFFHVRRMQASDVSFEESKKIAKDLGIDPSDVSFVAGRLSGRDLSLDGSVAPGDGGSLLLSEVIPDEAPHQEEQLIERDERENWSRRMRDALSRIPERERDILTARKLTDPPVSVDQIAARYGISKGRVTQLEQQAFARLKGLIDSAEAEQARVSERPRVPTNIFHRRIVR